MKRILPPSRPHRDEKLLRSIGQKHLVGEGVPYIVFIRGHYLDSMGKKNENDINVYDDSAYLVTPKSIDSFNANTDPSFVFRKGKPLAQLSLGRYRFYRGAHRGKYPALRAFPNGVKLPCTRNGEPSTCRYINVHKGGTKAGVAEVTWSEGCLTIPDIQYTEWVTRVWETMDKHRMDTILVILVENRRTKKGLQFSLTDRQMVYSYEGDRM